MGAKSQGTFDVLYGIVLANNHTPPYRFSAGDLVSLKGKAYGQTLLFGLINLAGNKARAVAAACDVIVVLENLNGELDIISLMHFMVEGPHNIGSGTTISPLIKSSIQVIFNRFCFVFIANIFVTEKLKNCWKK